MVTCFVPVLFSFCVVNEMPYRYSVMTQALDKGVTLVNARHAVHALLSVNKT